MAAVDDFIELLSIKPEKLGKIDYIFPDLGWGRDENGYPLIPAWYFTEMIQNIFEENETNRFKQP